MNIKRVVLFCHQPGGNAGVQPGGQPAFYAAMAASVLCWAGLQMGFGGAFISLFMSKNDGWRSTGVEIIDQPRNRIPKSGWWTPLPVMPRRVLALPCAEVVIYDGEPNAFAMGLSRNNSLVAVSTGLLHSMNVEEVEAVIGSMRWRMWPRRYGDADADSGSGKHFVFFPARVVASGGGQCLAPRQ